MKRYSGYLVALPLIIGLLTIAGWSFSIDILRRPIAGTVAMNPMTAACVVLCSMSFWFYYRYSASRTFYMLASVFATMVAAAGALKLLEVSGFVVHVDQWLFHEEVLQENLHGMVTRMAPNTAFNLLLMGTALLLTGVHKNSARHLSGWLAVAVFIISAFSFIGFVYHIQRYYGMLDYLPMAVQTSVCFVCLSLAFLFENSDQAFLRVISSSYIGGRTARILVPVAVLMPILLGYIRLYVSWHYPITDELGVAALVTSIIVMFLTVVWFVARALNVSDAARRSAEIELQRQAALFDLMPDAVLYGNRDLTITSINRAGEELLDTTAQKAIGRKIDDVVTIEVTGGATRESARASLWGAQGYWKGETTFTTGRGKKISALVSLKALRGSHGEAGGWMGIYTDITALKQVQQRLEFVLGGMVAGLWDWNFADNTRWWSPSYFALLGYEDGEITPSMDTLRQMVHPADLEYMTTTITKHKMIPDRFEMELRFRVKDGSYKWFSSVGKTKFDAKGVPQAMIGSIVDIDDKKKAQQSVQKQAALFDLMPDAVIYGRRDLAITSINRAGELMLDTTTEHAIGRKMDDLGKIELTGITREELRDNLWGEKGFWKGEITFTTIRGKKISTLVTLKTLKEEGPDGTAWMGIYTDITPLIDIQQRLEFALDGMVAGLWEWDIANPDNGWLSPRYLQLLGYEAGELSASVDAFKTLLHPEDLNNALIFFRAKAQERAGFEIELRYKIKSGGYKWFSVVGKTKFDSNNQPLSIIGSIVDIDDKKKAQQVIEQQALLIQMVPDGIIYADLNNHIISLNSGAEAMFEISSAQAAGKNIYDLVSIKIVGRSAEDVQQEFREKGYIRQEIEFTPPSGDKRMVLATARRYDELKGLEPGWICIYTDISPLKLNDELKTANNYLEQLAFITSHDIKAPIHTLEGLSALLARSQNLSPEEMDILQMQRDVIAQMQRTNKGLNEILKLRKGLVSGEAMTGETMTIRAILDNVLTNLHTHIETAGAELHIDLHDTGDITFPFFFLQSVFHNLISNAVKYRDPSRVPVVRFEVKRTGLTTLLLTISDNGMGLDMVRFREKLFGIFKRFHTQVEGTGVGLHIVKSIIDAAGGEIDVQSEVGKGTTFRITLKTPNLT